MRTRQWPERLAAAGLAAAGLDLALTTWWSALGATLGTTAFVAALALWGGIARTRAAVALLALAVVLSVFLTVRAGLWLTPFNALAVIALVVSSVALSGAGWPQGGFFASLRRLASVVAALGRAPASLARAALPRLAPLRSALPNDGAVLRGVAIAFPLLGVVAMLLASGDALFASYWRWELDLSDPARHLLWWGLGAASVVALADVAARPPRVAAARTAGHVESAILLGGFALLYALFAASQVAAVVGGRGYVAQRAGLTYAEYARSGFFQLLAAAAITLGVLLTLRPVRGAPGWVPAGGALTTVLSLAVVGSALRRLQLYSDAYGLTMLRLYSMLFSLWLAAVFVIAGVAVVRWVRWERVVPLAAAAALAGLVALNVMNPEAVVARSALARGARADPQHLAGLSDDAAPTLVARRATLPAAVDAALAAKHCTPAPRRVRPTGLAFNLAEDRAVRAWRSFCAGRAGPAGGRE